MAESKDNAGKLFIPETGAQPLSEVKRDLDEFVEEILEYLSRPIE